MQVAELIAVLGLEVDGGQFAAGQKAIEGIANALKALAVFKGAQMFEHWIMQTGELADAAKKTGERMGITAESVQELTWAAKSNDTSLEALAGGLKRVDRLISGFGGKKGAGATAALKDLGLAAKDLKDLTFDEKLGKIADGFKKLDDQKAIQVAQKLGMGTGPLLLLKQGSAGIKELREEARMLGLVIDNETAKSFEEWNDNLTRVKGAVQGLKNEAVVALLPTLKELTASLFAWIKANHELIKQRLEATLKVIVQLAQGLVKVIAIAWQLLEKIGPVIDNVLGAFLNLIGVATSASNELTAVAIAIGAFFALANLPIILLIGLISMAILVIDDLWSGLQGGDSVTGELLDSFEKALGESGVGRVVLALKASFEALFAFIEEKLEWLENKGRAIGKWAYELTHGDTQFQADQASTDTGGALKLQRARALLGPDATPGMLRASRAATGLTDEEIDQYSTRVMQADPSARGAFDKVSTMADTGIDRVVQAPELESMRGLWSKMLEPPAVHVAAPQLHVQVHISGQAEADLPDKITKSISEILNEAIRDAQVATGARGGRIP